jgi:phospholipid/cholesterol/gamma-HCH transport system permease protein
MILEQTKSVWKMYREQTGNRVVLFFERLHQIGAFAIITGVVTFRKFNVARRVVHPLIFHQILRSGVHLFGMVAFIGIALGLVIIGQTVTLLSQVGATEYVGVVMVTVVMRELGPLLTAVLVLARAGTANMVELGMSRALGEVEVLESLGIDPIHYLVMPRVIGLALAVFCLATYLVGMTFISGWLFAFLHNVPVTLSDYSGQLGAALHWEDFLLFAMKTSAFGVIIAVVSCYHGLAKPLKVEDVSSVTSRAVVESVVGCVLVDAVFIVAYLVL